MRMVYSYYNTHNKEINHLLDRADKKQHDNLEPSTAFFCKKCGKSNEFSHIYCFYCGENLEEAKSIVKNRIISERNKSKFLKCPDCRNPILNKFNFCMYCGRELKPKSRYIPKTIKKVVWIRDSGRCVECESTNDLQFDHIIPYSKGGSNTVKNLQILCAKCNRKKYNKIDG